jgi:hypothetical protein
MPEVSKDAKVLIDISFQALDRAKRSDERNKILDCTVALVFAGFFIEANLNHIIIEVLDKEQEIINFLKNDRAGVQDKLAWFYNVYVAEPESKLNSKTKDGMKGLYAKLRDKFPGFGAIYDFRNHISHGKIDSTISNLVDAERLRVNAKNIVDELFNIAEQVTGQPIARTVTYDDATSK